MHRQRAVDKDNGLMDLNRVELVRVVYQKNNKTDVMCREREVRVHCNNNNDEAFFFVSPVVYYSNVTVVFSNLLL